MDMENKEATPVEDVERLLPLVEPKQPAPPKEQPEVPTQTGDINVPEKEIEKYKTTEDSKMDKIMEMFLQMREDIGGTNKKMEENNKKMEGINKNIESKMKENGKKLEELKEDNQSLKEELSNKIENTNKKIDETRKKIEICLLYTSRCV